MSLSQQPYPPWRGLAASLILHAGLFGGFGPWSVSSGDEAPAPAMVELVSFPEAPVAAASPTVAAAPVAVPHAATQSTRPVRATRPASVPARTPPPIRHEVAASEEPPQGGDPASSATGTTGAGGGEGAAVAGTANGLSSAPPGSSDPVAMAGNPPPLYPMSARRMGREGRTVLLVTLSASGECAEVSVADSSGTPSLDEAAITAVKTWRFHPATRNSAPIPATLRVPVQFSLNSGLSGLPVVGQR